MVEVTGLKDFVIENPRSGLLAVMVVGGLVFGSPFPVVQLHVDGYLLLLIVVRDLPLGLSVAVGKKLERLDIVRLLISVN